MTIVSIVTILSVASVAGTANEFTGAASWGIVTGTGSPTGSANGSTGAATASSLPGMSFMETSILLFPIGLEHE